MTDVNLISPYVLSDLPYSYDALEPWCSSETLHLHHDKHHRAYVEKANEASEALSMVDPNDQHKVDALQSALTFNLSGHVMHSIFWDNLSPSKGRPTDSLKNQIESDFGDYQRFADMLATVCMGIQGSGWATLIFDPYSRSLRIGMVHDHQSEHLPYTSVLAVIDVWEHAYYLTYKNDRAKWAQTVIKHLNWETIALRFEDATNRSLVKGMSNA